MPSSTTYTTACPVATSRSATALAKTPPAAHQSPDGSTAYHKGDMEKWVAVIKAAKKRSTPVIEVFV